MMRRNRGLKRRIRRLKWRVRWLRRRARRLKWRLSNSWIGTLVVGGWQRAKNLPNSTAFWLALVGIVLLGSILGLAFWGWDWLSETKPNLPSESRSTTIRNAGFVIAGAIALVFAVWRGVVAQHQAETAQRQSETSQQGLLNERYQKGAEMLGNSILSVRLGGIYALQRLAEEHPGQYHLQIIELFCAFVRFPTGDNRMEFRSEVDEELDERTSILRPDVQDTMRFLGSRSQEGIRIERREGIKLYLRDANMSNLQTVDANLSRAWLTHANLSNAELRRADLSYARLHQANLFKAKLQNADLYRASLNDANLSDASLTGANLSRARLARANLSDAFLSRSDLSNAFLSRANLSKAIFWSADLSNADLAGADLTGAGPRGR